MTSEFINKWNESIALYEKFKKAYEDFTSHLEINKDVLYDEKINPYVIFNNNKKDYHKIDWDSPNFIELGYVFSYFAMDVENINDKLKQL